MPWTPDPTLTLPEPVAEWPVLGIYCNQTTDPVLGGPEGPQNYPLIQLWTRMRYLKQRLDGISSMFGPDGLTIDDMAGLEAALLSLAAGATADALGRVMLASGADVLAGLEGTKAVTSATLALLTGTEARAGLLKIASAAQSAAMALSDVAMPPSGLGAAFGGANQSLNVPGFQRYPAPAGQPRLIQQWGTAALNGNTSVSFPFAFPTKCIGVAVTRTASSSGEMEYAQVSSHSAASFSIIGLSGNDTFAAGAFAADWMAWGW